MCRDSTNWVHWHGFTSLAFETSIAGYFFIKLRYLLEQSESPEVTTAESKLCANSLELAPMRNISGAFLPHGTTAISDSE